MNNLTIANDRVIVQGFYQLVRAVEVPIVVQRVVTRN